MSQPHRFFALPSSISLDEIVISKEESKHIFLSFRYKIGDEVEFFDGKGNVYLCRLVSRDRAVILNRQVYKPVPYKLAIAQSLLKGKKMEFVVKRLTEMAVSIIIPVYTERSLVRCNSINRNRWYKLAIESAKQSRNPFLPELEKCRSISEFLSWDRCDEFSLKVFLDIFSSSTVPLKEVLKRDNAENSLLAVVGPEGGFADKERDVLKESGFIPVHMGKSTVMRSEIASFLLGGIILYEFS